MGSTGLLFGVILSLGLFIWGLFMPWAAGYTYIILYSVLAGYAFIIDKIKPDVDPKKWTLEEIDIIKKYYAALRFSFGARSLSLFLNSFRFASILFVILFLFDQMWIHALFYALFFVIIFFVTSPLIVRLDPFFCLNHKAQKGDLNAEYELFLLKDIFDKIHIKNSNS